MPTILPRTKSDHGSFINLGGVEESKHLATGDNSPIFIGDSRPPAHDTWLRFAGKQAGRLIEGTTDVATAPVKWLNHMQDNW
ncbi:unnamed protein product [Adineta ricciae]|uniref:Uncharacterized protein n=1 Tax=Adineta ricciae TaxID=249248 RepID=A0A816FGT8_ADIRI|nr:unnamed protein product [Adineta ricciae]CAF1661297.1 unnamed protein product [Adineta ricciae]